MGLADWEEFLRSRCANCSLQFANKHMKFTNVTYGSKNANTFEELSNFDAISYIYGIPINTLHEKLASYCKSLAKSNSENFWGDEQEIFSHFPEFPELTLCRKCAPVISRIYKYHKIFCDLSESSSVIFGALRNDFEASQNVKCEPDDWQEENTCDNFSVESEIRDVHQPTAKNNEESFVRFENEEVGGDYSNMRVTRRMARSVRQSADHLDALNNTAIINTDIFDELSNVDIDEDSADRCSDGGYSNESSNSEFDLSIKDKYSKKCVSRKRKPKRQKLLPKVNHTKMSSSSETENGVERELKHSNSNRKHRKRFGCSVCFEEFPTCHQMKWHKLTHFGDPVEVSKHVKGPPYVCPACNKSYKALSSLQFHAMRKHKVKIPNKLEHVSSGWDCEECLLSFSNVEELKAHYETIHNQNFFCKYCYNSFREESLLKSHLIEVHRKRYADMKFYYKPAIYLKRPKLKSKIPKRRPVLHYPCKKCHQLFSTPYKLKKHKLIHIEGVKTSSTIISGPPFICPQCNKSYKSFHCLNEHSLIRHKLKYPSPVIGSCAKCDVTFSNVEELEEHCRSIHGIEYFCKYCNKSFLNSPALQIHESSHEEKANKYVDADVEGQIVPNDEAVPQSFPCRSCKKVFETYKLAKTHERMHKSGEIPRPGYTCEVCGKWFKYAGTLYSHRLSHSNLKPHMCDRCGRSFKHRNLFLRHVNDHDEMEKNIRPECKVCGKTFRHSTSLRRHKSRFHTGKSKPECPLCHKGFSNPYNVRVHLKICKATTENETVHNSNLENVNDKDAV